MQNIATASLDIDYWCQFQAENPKPCRKAKHNPLDLLTDAGMARLAVKSYWFEQVISIKSAQASHMHTTEDIADHDFEGDSRRHRAYSRHGLQLLGGYQSVLDTPSLLTTPWRSLKYVSSTRKHVGVKAMLLKCGLVLSSGPWYVFLGIEIPAGWYWLSSS